MTTGRAFIMLARRKFAFCFHDEGTASGAWRSPARACRAPNGAPRFDMTPRDFLREHAPAFRDLAQGEALEFDAELGDVPDDLRAPGHRFTVVGGSGAGDAYLEWIYPGLAGAPPVVFVGDGPTRIVADSTSGFVWQLLAPRSGPDTHAEARRELRQVAVAVFGPPPRSAPRAHPDPSVLDHVPRRRPAPEARPTPAVADASWAAGLEDFEAAVEQARRRPELVHSTAAWAESRGDIDLALSLLDGIGAAVAAFELLVRSGRPVDQRRLVALGTHLFDRRPAVDLSSVDPDALHAARIALDDRERTWGPAFAEARSGVRGGRTEPRLRLLLAQHVHQPVCQATVGLALAELRLQKGDRRGAREALEAARAARVPALADALDRLEAACAPQHRRSPPAGPSDLPVVEQVAADRGIPVEEAARWLAERLAVVAGPGAEATFDGGRFRVVRSGATLPVDALLDAALEGPAR